MLTLGWAMKSSSNSSHKTNKIALGFIIAGVAIWLLGAIQVTFEAANIYRMRKVIYSNWRGVVLNNLQESDNAAHASDTISVISEIPPPNYEASLSLPVPERNSEEPPPSYSEALSKLSESQPTEIKIVISI